MPLILEDMAAKAVVDSFVEKNERRWNDSTYKYNCWVLYNFAETFPVLPTVRNQVLDYLRKHTRKKSKYRWQIGTMRSCYKVIRALYTWAKEAYPGGENLMILPAPSNREIRNFGRMRSGRKAKGL